MTATTTPRVYTPARGVEARLISMETLVSTETRYDALCAKADATAELNDNLFGGIAGFDHTAISAMRRASRFTRMDKATAESVRRTVRNDKLLLDCEELESGFTAGVKRASGVKANVDPATAILGLLAIPGVKDNPDVLAALKALLGL